MSKECKAGILIGFLVLVCAALIMFLVEVVYAGTLVSDNSTETVETCEIDGNWTLPTPILCVMNSHGGIHTGSIKPVHGTVCREEYGAATGQVFCPSQGRL
jgi:hypothetical protein